MEPVGIWEWFLLILLFTIPVVNIITIIVIACGAGKPSVVNFCRAFLIWFAIGFSFAILFTFVSF